MRIQFIDIIKHAHGKLSKKSDIYVRHFHKSGKQYATQRKEGYQNTRSPEQAAMRKAFGDRNRAAKRWLDANRNPPTEAYLKIRDEFERQTTYNTLQIYVANAYILPGLPLPE